jgi:geranylgeranyl diphosphate synthase type I
VKGGARCELAGYSAITDLTDHFKRMCSRIDRSIESFFPKNPDSENLRNYLGAPYWAHEPVVVEEMISKPVWELMNRSGKRWRPLFTYYLLKALGMDPRPYEQAVFALSELIHTGSLIIDDIQDGSPLRRGEESIHLRYGQDVAITAGNTLYFLPSILIMDHPVLAGSQKHEILQIMNRQLIRAHIGQSMDLYWSRQYESNGSDPADDPLILDRILQMYALKTGAPIQGLAEMSAVIARMPPEVRAACGEFALSMGIAFQIVDDVRNLSAGEKTGKIAGEDLQDGKITYAMVACLKQVGSEERKFLTGLLKSREQRCDAGLIDRGLDIIRKSGGLERCRTLATVMLDQAWIGFEAHLSPSDSKTMLRWLAGSLINPAD